jgi:hypothetical protein
MGSGKARLHVPELQGNGLVDVGPELEGLDGLPLLLQGFLDAHVGRKRLEIKLDEFPSPLRCILVDGGHGRDRVPHVADLVRTQGLLVLADGEDAVLLREVLAR